jgi:transmembrane sensor
MIANDELLRIMERISETTATEAEIIKFNAWCNAFKGTEQEVPNLEAIQNRVLKRVHRKINKKTTILPLHISRIAIAAAAVAAVVFGVWYFYSSQYLVFSSQTVSGQSANDIAPGKNTATLTLANGKTINLSDAKTGVVIGENNLAYNDGSLVQVSVPSPDAKEQLTVSTPRGGTYQVTLSDGTKVWLNAASALSYSTALNDRGERRVKLAGEAYFEVAKDKQHPFVVESGGQEVTVLGTHFNINAYKDEPGIKTTLIEGSVKVAGEGFQTVIKPGQQASFKAGGINVEEVNLNTVTDWKNGKFRFKNEPLTSILRKVSRWYDVEIVYQSDLKNMPTFSGSVSRFDNVSAVLQMLEETSDVKFSIEGKTIKVQ